VTSLSRIDRVIWDMATDDINRSPDVLPHTKLRVKVSRVAIAVVVVGGVDLARAPIAAGPLLLIAHSNSGLVASLAT
jgi:hypothetical protein